jgi:hypothetical protein
MVEPRIVRTKLTQSGVHAPPPQDLLKMRSLESERIAEEDRQKKENVVRIKKRELITVLWGVLFLSGGVAVWFATSKKPETLAEPWRESSSSVAGLTSDTRPNGGEQSNLLRLEWPAHPRAEGYLIRFLDRNGNGPAPIPVQGSVFLYDMQSDVLNLPDRFLWEVTALLSDGTKVVTPPCPHPAPGAGRARGGPAVESD